MPRPRHAQGRPRTDVIPFDWETPHRPVAEKTMTATVALHRPGTTQTWSADLEQMVATPRQPYAVRLARIQALATQAREQVAAEDTETVASYLVAVPDDVPALEGDLVTVTGSGVTLRVVQVVRGSLRFERDLICTLTD